MCSIHGWEQQLDVQLVYVSAGGSRYYKSHTSHILGMSPGDDYSKRERWWWINKEMKDRDAWSPHFPSLCMSFHCLSVRMQRCMCCSLWMQMLTPLAPHLETPIDRWHIGLNILVDMCGYLILRYKVWITRSHRPMREVVDKLFRSIFSLSYSHTCPGLHGEEWLHSYG